MYTDGLVSVVDALYKLNVASNVSMEMFCCLKGRAIDAMMPQACGKTLDT